ncbi:MAG: AmpG family muropeptide MFS transporter [Oligoflexia bacterium]|nr:MAG: AmpG family muropeptide MFS transporter [Oligoflexia bacterium]
MTRSSTFWKSLFTKQMMITLLMGFASGLPFLLVGRTLQAWMTEDGVDLKTVGFFTLATIPVSFKFVWAPLLDRFQLPLGRRRGWLLFSQLVLGLVLIGISTLNPKVSLEFLVGLVVLASFFSANQDIVVDAYRRETLSDADLGIGSTFYVYGYRVAMWISGGLALILAQSSGWRSVYFAMGIIMLLNILVTLWANEPVAESTPKNFREMVIEPFSEFLKRKGAYLVIAFVLLYKVGDNIAGNMLTPYYLKMGYSKAEIGWIAKTLSFPFVLIASFIGGALVKRLGIVPSLWAFGILQALSTVSFSLLNHLEHNNVALASVILFEDISSAMGSAAFIAFMSSLTNKRFSATQYALLTSLMNIPARVIPAFSGVLAESLGWTGFFVLCSLVALPGLLLIKIMTRMQNE